MSASERVRFAVLVEPEPTFVNNTESPFAGRALLTQDPAVPQFALFPPQVNTAAVATFDRVQHTSIVLAAHRQAEAILKVIFMVLAADLLGERLSVVPVEPQTCGPMNGGVYRLGG